jgi:hypothetical protein
MPGSAADARRLVNATVEKQDDDLAGPQGSLDHQATQNGLILGGTSRILRDNAGPNGDGVN